MSFRSSRLLKAAKDQPCVLCHAIGTTVACHLRSVEFGSGTGIKCPDYYTAWLCQSCHNIVDGRTGQLSREKKNEMWIRAYLRTVAQWFEQELVIVCGKRD